jgi:rubredoxin-NAD+ reductase
LNIPSPVPVTHPITIIGSGLAAYTVIREIRKINIEVGIVLITREPGYFYSKPMLSTAFASKKTAPQLIVTPIEKMASSLGITIHPNTTVTQIDPLDKKISSSSGDFHYSKLVLALGADQMKLDLEGNGADQVLFINDLEDYQKFRGRIEGKRKISILGAGLIGCEFANDLSLGGFDVDVIDLAPQVLGRLLPPEAAQVLQEKLSALGVTWHLSTTVHSMNHQIDQFKIELANGCTINCDTVLSAIGLKPRIQLAKECGLDTQIGIVVNLKLQTSNPDIYAIGDCAEVGGLVLPYVMPIMQAARALAPNILGGSINVSYPAMPVAIKTPVLPTIVSPPAHKANGNWETHVSADGVEARFKDTAGNLLGFVLMGSATAQKSNLTKELPNLL